MTLNKIAKTLATNFIQVHGRVVKFIDQEKLLAEMNVVIMSQFSYCPAIWMFHDRKVNNKINKSHKTALRIAFKDES